MKILTYVFTAWLIINISSEKIRFINYEGRDVKTTFDVPSKFFGEYKGRKSGYLILNEDGTGYYKYDVFGFAPASCKNQPIQIEWGLLLDKNDRILKFDREYGFSFPMLLKSVGETSFKGCRDEVLLDFIMEYKDGSLGVSSSDDWKK